jgi:hypothetical protein
MCDQGSNSRPPDSDTMIEGPSSANPTIKLKWYKMGDMTFSQVSTSLLLHVSHGPAAPVVQVESTSLCYMSLIV